METAKRQVRNTKGTRKNLSLIDNTPKSALNVPEAQRNSRIAEVAYYRAQARGFSPGHELEDWLAAEAEVNR